MLVTIGHCVCSKKLNKSEQYVLINASLSTFSLIHFHWHLTLLFCISFLFFNYFQSATQSVGFLMEKLIDIPECWEISKMLSFLVLCDKQTRDDQVVIDNSLLTFPSLARCFNVWSKFIVFVYLAPVIRVVCLMLKTNKPKIYTRLFSNQGLLQLNYNFLFFFWFLQFSMTFNSFGKKN